MVGYAVCNGDIAAIAVVFLAPKPDDVTFYCPFSRLGRGRVGVGSRFDVRPTAMMRRVAAKQQQKDREEWSRPLSHT